MQLINTSMFFLMAVAVKASGKVTQIAGVFPEFYFFANANNSTYRFYRVHQCRMGQADPAAFVWKKGKQFMLIGNAPLAIAGAVTVG